MNSYKAVLRTAMDGRLGFYGLDSPFLLVGVADPVVSTTYNHISLPYPSFVNLVKFRLARKATHTRR